MPRTAARPSAITMALLFLLAAMLCSSCRAPEPPVEQKTPEKETALALPIIPVLPVIPILPIPAPQPPPEPSRIYIDPGIVLKEPERPPSDTAVPLPKPLLREETRLPYAATQRPRIAIIIDDMGHHQQLGRQFLQLDLNLSFAFLPDAPYSAELSATAYQSRRDILVHLPMEPKNPAKHPGANALSVQDTPEQIRQKMAGMLDAVPHAVGANNHMGSRFTEDSGAMQVVIDTLKNRSFFFIDSFTTVASRGLTVARQQGVPTAPRHVFLDAVQEPHQICRQIDQLVAGAKKRGWAIGIGHPHGATLTALTRYNRERLLEVEIVGVHQLVE